MDVLAEQLRNQLLDVQVRREDDVPGVVEGEAVYEVGLAGAADAAIALDEQSVALEVHRGAHPCVPPTDDCWLRHAISSAEC